MATLRWHHAPPARHSARLTAYLSEDDHRVALVEQHGQVAGCALWTYLGRHRSGARATTASTCALRCGYTETVRSTRFRAPGH
jgi:hypothetical protein